MYSSVNGECQPDSPKLCPSGPRRGEHALRLPAPGGLLSLAPGLLSLNGGTKRGLGLKPVWPMHHPQLPPPGSSDALGAVRNPPRCTAGHLPVAPRLCAALPAPSVCLPCPYLHSQVLSFPLLDSPRELRLLSSRASTGMFAFPGRKIKVCRRNETLDDLLKPAARLPPRPCGWLTDYEVYRDPFFWAVPNHAATRGPAQRVEGGSRPAVRAGPLRALRGYPSGPHAPFLLLFPSPSPAVLEKPLLPHAAQEV